MTAKLTAPAPGDTVQIRATVLTSDQYDDGRHYGPSSRVVLRLENEVGGYAFANCFLTADSAGRWFSKPAQTALKRLENGEDISQPKPKPAPKAKADDQPAQPKPSLDTDDVTQMTVRQLKVLADTHGLTYSKSVRKAELLAQIKDALADQPTEATAA